MHLPNGLVSTSGGGMGGMKGAPPNGPGGGGPPKGIIGGGGAIIPPGGGGGPNARIICIPRSMFCLIWSTCRGGNSSFFRFAVELAVANVELECVVFCTTNLTK